MNGTDEQIFKVRREAEAKTNKLKENECYCQAYNEQTQQWEIVITLER